MTIQVWCRQTGRFFVVLIYPPNMWTRVVSDWLW